MKKSYFIFLFLFVYLSNHAQIEFKNHIISDERFLFREANSILPIDIDGDGDLDVFASTTNFPRNKVVWYENIDGHGRFGNQKIILNNFDNVSSIYSEDLDADGDMDLLVTSASDDTVLWYQNTDGKGSFVSHQVVDIELDGARSVSAKDLDGDGNIDIVASGSTTAREEIVWYKNVNGQGDFGAKQTITLYDSFSFFHNTFRNIVSCEDIDGDGDIDVLASSSFNSLAWYENIDGKGNFDNRNTIKGPFSGRIRSLQVKDIDGDGDMDIFSTSGLKILWNKNDGKGNFGEPKVISENSGEVESIFVEDFNNDGNMDILSVFGRSLLNDGMIIYYPGIDNQGTWGEQKIISENLKNPKMIYAADMDGDRDLDILSSSNEHRGRIDWYPNIENSGKFEAPNIISRRVSNISSLSSGDIDGDGDIDLLVSSTDKKITLYPNLDGQGYFNTQYIIDENSNIPNSTDLKDIDNDGHLDIIVAYNTKIAWKRNIEGIGNFEEERIILEYDFTDFKDVIVLDFDNDGDNDVLTLAKGSKGGLILIKNTNNGEFEKEQLITNGDLDAINVGDIDGDGDIDIVLNVNGIISLSPSLSISEI